MINKIEIPQRFYDVSYNSSRIPGVKYQSNLSLGANCQVFAYELLKHFGKVIPPFRSSELWDDQIHTKKVERYEPLDIMLYHNEPKAFGAHVGIYIGEGKVFHLSSKVGTPEITTHDKLLLQECYSYFIGAKRIYESDKFETD